MFGIGSFYFKMKAKAALKGNWQTAMLVAFFSGIFGLALQVYQARFMTLSPQQINGLMMVSSFEQLWPLFGITKEILWGFLGLALLAALVSPALTLGCNHYFVERLRGEEMGFGGLFSRFCIFFKALWLNLLMTIKTLLWGLVILGPFLALVWFVPQTAVFLLKHTYLITVVSLAAVIPPLLAALRYAMANYIMAHKPDTGAWEAIEQSKKMMKSQKSNYLMLNISFAGWMLLSMLVNVLLSGISPVVGLVAQLFLETWIMAYMNGSLASFYLVVAEEDGLMKAAKDLQKMMENAGVDFPEMPEYPHSAENAWNRPDEGNGAEEPAEEADGEPEDDSASEDEPID